MPRRRSLTTAVLLLVVSVSAPAEELFRCRDATGGIAYSDLPCRGADGTAAGKVDVTDVPGSFVEGGSLTAADRAHLERIERRAEARAKRATGDGKRRRARAREARAKRCARARRRLEALRAASRRPHETPLYQRRREARARVRTHCH